MRTEAAGRFRDASRLIVLLGMVSLCADATYESARSILGPYLASLGASGQAVGMVAGLGELIGYGLRFGSGYLADRTGRYWGLALIGFSLNMAAVPLLALAVRWEWVAGLIAVERGGKAIRNPPRDAILSHAAEVVGRGWGFGLQEALGQIGAVLGPLVISVALSGGADYRACLAALVIPACLTVLILAAGARAYPHPQALEEADAPPSPAPAPEAPATPAPAPEALATPTPAPEAPPAPVPAPTPADGGRLPRSFWVFLAAAGLVAAGSLDFPLAAFHIQHRRLLPEARIPVLYAVAMGAHALSALGFGLLFDRVGPRALLCVCALTTPVAPLIFALGGHPAGLLAAMVLWGLSMGAQKAMFKASVAEMAPTRRRAFAYGCFDLCYGISWFLGSLLMGVCYERSLSALVLVSSGTQLLAVPLLAVVVRRASAARREAS